MGQLQDYHNAGDDGNAGLPNDSDWYAQTFKASSAYDLQSVKLKLWVSAAAGVPTNVTVSIKAVDGAGKPTDEDLVSKTIAGSTITTSSPGTFIEFTFGSALSLTSGISYAIVLRWSGGGWGLSFRYDLNSGYDDGALVTSSTSGDTWQDPSETNDGLFETYDEYTFSPPSSGPDITVIKRLVVAGNNEIWYEDI